jgi:hypothetical protein
LSEEHQNEEEAVHEDNLQEIAKAAEGEIISQITAEVDPC